MLSLSLALMLLSPAVGQATPERVVRPLTTDDALAVLYVAQTKVIPLGDLDDDGSPEVAIPIVDREAWAIDAWSVRSGKPVRRLWKGSGSGGWGAELVWDAGGDVDADGVPDLLVGLPRESSVEKLRGAVVVVSGGSGEELHRSNGEAALDTYGSSLAFVGDLDGDGRDDYVVGSPRADPDGDSLRPDGALRPVGRGTSQQPLRRGRVVARSGRDGSELWTARGGSPGHAFGWRVQPVGDLDRDGIADVLVQCFRRSSEDVTLLSGATGAELGRLAHDHGTAGSAGDLDGDGVLDLFLDRQDLDGGSRKGSVRIVSGATRGSMGQIPYPDPWGGDYGVTTSLGDLDGDGFDELAVGEPDFHLAGPGDPGFQGEAPDLGQLTLAQAARLPSRPWNAFCPESGCLLVYSGRTRQPIWGIFGHPGSREGIGFHVAAIPDISGDGSPDLLVAGGDRTYVFPGPGRSGR